MKYFFCFRFTKSSTTTSRKTIGAGQVWPGAASSWTWPRVGFWSTSSRDSRPRSSWRLKASLRGSTHGWKRLNNLYRYKLTRSIILSRLSLSNGPSTANLSNSSTRWKFAIFGEFEYLLKWPFLKMGRTR